MEKPAIKFNKFGEAFYQKMLDFKWHNGHVEREIHEDDGYQYTVDDYTFDDSEKTVRNFVSCIPLSQLHSATFWKQLLENETFFESFGVPLRNPAKTDIAYHFYNAIPDDVRNSDDLYETLISFFDRHHVVSSGLYHPSFKGNKKREAKLNAVFFDLYTKNQKITDTTAQS